MLMLACQNHCVINGLDRGATAAMPVISTRSAAPIDEAIITLKPAESSTVVAGLISTEIFCRFVDMRGRQEEIQVPLPATPGFARTKEVVITFRAVVKGRPVDLFITGLRITPIAPTDRLPGTETSRAVERP